MYISSIVFFATVRQFFNFVPYLHHNAQLVTHLNLQLMQA